MILYFLFSIEKKYSIIKLQIVYKLFDMLKENKNIQYSEIIITKKDLPLSCPIKQTWDGHPKIYLNILSKKIVKCPYCGIKYRLIE